MENYNSEQNLQEAAERLKSVIDTAIDGIITIDERGIVETMNPAAAKLFGYPLEDVIGQNISMLMPTPYRAEHDGYLERYLRTRTPHIIGIGREVRGKCKDGTIFPMRLAVSEMVLSGRRVFTGIVHDLSQVKQAEAAVNDLNQRLEEKNQQLAHQNDVLEKKVVERTQALHATVQQLTDINQQLEAEIAERKIIEEKLNQGRVELEKALAAEQQLNEMKSRFVSMASHEFRTPLSTVLSSVELVEAYGKHGKWDRQVKHIERIKSSIRSLTDILNDFLSLSRLEEGQIQSQPEWINLATFCTQILSEIEGMLRPGQVIQHHGNVQPTDEIYTDPKIFKNILFNLLSNAIKYSSHDLPIECTTQLQDNGLKITVRDYGIGIPQSDQQHIYDRFFRAKNSENIQGTGLGLNIVVKYLNMLGGSIDFKSVEGEGTTFWVELPVGES